MTTQVPHLYARRARSAASPALRGAGPERTGGGAGASAGPGGGPGAQTRLPWWALALPALAFAVLLALFTGGGADASTAASSGDWLSHAAMLLSGMLHHVL
ncbi:hypothetical protein [Actinacidiphila acididurans]|uniref:Uncharacterized protein n=1 Tax=Actinacidiphila acididurans TaxID=2784346 RepID=A0ABS2TUR9_9ACTN|nr:hypothetical protein [Actinacidiphila acididurans]MBM9505703.1 hypothetical protein [Actinacidiphila acididurans]